MTRLLRWAGWLCVAVGLLIGLYLVYALLWTGRETVAVQRDALEAWAVEVPGGVDGLAAPTQPAPDQSTEPAPDQPTELPPDPAGTPAGDAAPVAAPPPAVPGEPLAVLQFNRPGAVQAPAHTDPLVVFEGVGVTDLRRGPGHYPGTSLPGQAGNFAVAGHRTTYSAPFYNLDQLRQGDEVWVTDRAGMRWTYRVSGTRIVSPSDTGVLAPDPVGTGRPMLTLTTCHPRFSDAARLIVFAELAGVR